MGTTSDTDVVQPPARGLVGRDRLAARLRAGAATPLITAIAPAGYGKTTLVSAWAEADPRAVAWITLDERHRDPAVLVGSIAAELDRIEAIGEEVFAPLRTPRPNIGGSVLPRLCDALGARSDPFVFVLDDAHEMDPEDGPRFLAQIVRNVPAGSQFVIAARGAPGLPLGTLRAEGRLTELGVEDLRMTRGEAARMFEGCDIDLSSASLDLLLDRTEGWPVGLYLAALTLADEDEVESAIRSFHGDDRLVADYLRDAFLADRDADELDFLTKASVLGELSGELCDAVLEREGSAELLRRLARSNLLVSPLDRRDRSYRQHGLLRQMLRSELQRLGPREEAALHARASDWYDARGDADRAIAHAIEADNAETAARLIWAKAPEYEASGRNATLVRWLEGFGDEQVREIPELALTRSLGMLSAGDGTGVEHWTGTALGRLGTSAEERPELELTAGVVRAAGAARAGVTEMREVMAEAFALMQPDDPWRAVCRCIEGVALQLGEDPETARPILEEAARIGATLAPTLQSIARAQLGLLSADEHDWDEAHRQVTAAGKVVEHYGLGDYETQAIVFAVSALVNARRGRAAEASRELRAAGELLGELNEFSPWYEAEVRIVQARTLLALDDVGGARARLSDAARYLRGLEDAPALRRWVADAWSQADAAATEGGRWPLTPAELRLLHLLPTHHTLREIGEQLYVSQNTVKTQAQSVYRKLGVSSRAEAVSSARAAGLLRGEDGNGASS